MPLPHLARLPPASNSTPCQAAGAARASDQRLVYFSEVYWSACYNANLWQIRHNLQKDTIATMLPILPILCLLAAPPFFPAATAGPPGPPRRRSLSSPALAGPAAANPASRRRRRRPGTTSPQDVLQCRRAEPGKPRLDLRPNSPTGPPLRQAFGRTRQLPGTPPGPCPADSPGIANSQSATRSPACCRSATARPSGATPSCRTR